MAMMTGFALTSSLSNLIINRGCSGRRGSSIIVHQYHHHHHRITGSTTSITTNRMLAATARLASSTSTSASLPRWATLDPSTLGSNAVPHAVLNLVNGNWSSSESTLAIPNPMDRDAPPVCTIPDTGIHELGPFVESLRNVPKSGIHNPMKNVERYRQFGEISRKVRSSSRECLFLFGVPLSSS
jgi:hypothetical protein